MGGRRSQKEEGERQPRYTPLQPCPAAQNSVTQPTGPLGWGTQLSPLRVLRPLGRGLLTEPGLAPRPSVLCRWQLKISSARRRYLVIFSFTASPRSLLGSTVGGRGLPGPTPAPALAVGGWGCGCRHLPAALHRTESPFLRLVSDSDPTSVLEPLLWVETGGVGGRRLAGEAGSYGRPRLQRLTVGTRHLAGSHHTLGRDRGGVSMSSFRGGDTSSPLKPSVEKAGEGIGVRRQRNSRDRPTPRHRGVSSAGGGGTWLRAPLPPRPGHSRASLSPRSEMPSFALNRARPSPPGPRWSLWSTAQPSSWTVCLLSLGAPVRVGLLENPLCQLGLDSVSLPSLPPHCPSYWGL